jgi:hypothetical protein
MPVGIMPKNLIIISKRSLQYVLNYKESQAKMEQAYNMAVVNVIINPIQDNSYFNNSGWGNTGYSYSNDYFQQNLIRDLGGYRSNKYPAHFILSGKHAEKT